MILTCLLTNISKTGFCEIVSVISICHVLFLSGRINLLRPKLLGSVCIGGRACRDQVRIFSSDFIET